MCTNYVKAQKQVNNNINNHSSHYSSAEYVEMKNPLVIFFPFRIYLAIEIPLCYQDRYGLLDFARPLL